MSCAKSVLVALVLSAAVFAASAGSARADVIGMWFVDTSASSLYFDDGTWNEGDDWSYWTSPPNAAALLNETWTGRAPVTMDAGVETDGVDPDVAITKVLNNDTDFNWTDFHIQLTPAPGTGPLVVYSDSVSSNRFSDVVVTNHGDGSANIDFFSNLQLGDTPVLIGESVTLEFTFNVPGTVWFKMHQVPTPEPSSLMMLALGGIALARRRR